MARHSNGKNNYALSGGAIVALAALIALVAGLTWYLAARGGDDSRAEDKEATCVSGELTLPIAASNDEVAGELISAYADSKPVVRDYCVTPQLTSSVEDAAVYVAPNTAITHQRLSQSHRTSAVAEPAIVYADVVGLAGKALPDGDVALAKVRFPTDTPESSAVAASVLANGDSEAIAALTNQRTASADGFDAAGGDYVATSKLAAPGGLEFRPLAASVTYAAIPLNSGESVDENQARAGQDFARFAAERFDATGQPEQPVTSEAVWAAALPAGGDDITKDGAAPTDAPSAAVAADGGVKDTLFLLDTSEAMAGYLEPAKDAIADAAGSVTAAGKKVALWNYSSPLSAGVTQGYRDNVAMTDNAAVVQDAVHRFLAGGVPQTREAVTAAVASMTGPGRIVVITSGTADAGDDAAFRDAIKASRGDVTISVVHVGPGQQDATLESIATSRQEVDTANEMAAAVSAAAGKQS